MPQLDQKGVVAQLLVVLLLVAGLVVGVYLVQTRTNLFPKAAVSRPIGPETSFTLIGPTGCTAGILCALSGQHIPEEQFAVRLYVRSDIEKANLFTAKMKFPKDLVEIKEIKTAPSFVKTWAENFYDNNTGEISLVGGVPSPGYQTQVGQEGVLMATIIFRAKALGRGEVTFTDSSAIYSNLNNINILTIKRPYDISIEVRPSPTPISAPISPTPVPSCLPRPACLDAKPACQIAPPVGGYCRPAPSPVPGTGDGNGDGKINLVDLSVLLSDYNKNNGFRTGIDMNGDGKINAFDFALIRNLLIQKGVIRG